MFLRKDIKAFAKQRIQYGRGTAIGVTFVAGLLGASWGGSSIDLPFDAEDGEKLKEWLSNIPSISAQEVATLVKTAALSSVMAMIIGIFVSNVVLVGLRGWFLRYQRGEQVPFGELFAAFRFYVPSLLTRLLTELYTLLWTFLLIIPGIVKSYAYSMADYIVYENPNLSASRAIDMSQRMTDGYKWDLFLLDLSLIGWNLLDMLTAGILGIVYVNPYILTIYAAVYECLKINAIRDGRLTWADFGQMPPEQPPVTADFAVPFPPEIMEDPPFCDESEIL